jgi:hypothetical protein
MNLNQLLNADNECVGYFTDDAAGRAAMQAARAEWQVHHLERRDAWACRSIATPIKSLALEDVEPGDGDRVDYFAPTFEHTADEYVGSVVSVWLERGAASVVTRRHEINRYRRPGKSNRSADLGGPEQAAGVLYVLTIKASK